MMHSNGFDTHLQLARVELRTFTYSMLSNDLATISLHLRSRLDLDDAIRHDQDAMFLASEFDDGKLAPAQQSCCSIYPEVFSLCSSIR